MLSKQPQSSAWFGNGETTDSKNAASFLKCDELQETNELLHEQIASLKAELSEKNEHLRSLEQELFATNQEIDLINQELQSHSQQASLPLPDAIEVAQRMLLTSLMRQDTTSKRYLLELIAQLLSEIYGTTVYSKQLDFVQSCLPFEPKLYLHLIMAWNVHQRKKLRHQFIELGTRFVNSKAVYEKLRQQFQASNDEHQCSDTELAELVKVLETVASQSCLESNGDA